MDNNLIMLLHNSILFSISCAFDLVIFCLMVFSFYKIYKIKNLVTNNSNKILNHDDELLNVEETLEKIQNK
jgi:hypothetical protein